MLTRPKAAALTALGLLLLGAPESEASDVDWPVYLGDSRRSHYSELAPQEPLPSATLLAPAQAVPSPCRHSASLRRPKSDRLLDQINRDNVGQLELAWVYNSGEPQGTMYTSPLVVDGALYGLSPSVVPFALNAATGKEVWRNEELDLPSAAQRGLM